MLGAGDVIAASEGGALAGPLGTRLVLRQDQSAQGSWDHSLLLWKPDSP